MIKLIQNKMELTYLLEQGHYCNEMKINDNVILLFSRQTKEVIGCKILDYKQLLTPLFIIEVKEGRLELYKLLSLILWTVSMVPMNQIALKLLRDLSKSIPRYIEVR